MLGNSEPLTFVNRVVTRSKMSFRNIYLAMCIIIMGMLRVNKTSEEAVDCSSSAMRERPEVGLLAGIRQMKTRRRKTSRKWLLLD